MLRIGIDTFSFDRPGENFGVGPGVYVWHLLERLVRVGAKHRFFVFTNRENAAFVPEGPNVELVTSPLPNKFRPFRILHEQLWVPFYSKRLRLDGVHFLGNNISFLIADRSILTVYDLMWKYYLSRGERNPKYRYFALTVPPSLRRARALITISHFISLEIQREFSIPSERVAAIPLAAGRQHEPDATLLSALRTEFDFPFILSVTTSFPHKNLITLINAYAKLKRQGIYRGKLVVAGQLKGPYSDEILGLIRATDCAEDIKLLGFVSEPKKLYLYRTADILVYPSLYEGFGLPILEAMQSGTPVVCARAASLPEVGGDACIYFDPLSDADLANSIEEILRDPTAQQELIRLGHERASRFSWESTARLTMDVYESVLG